MPLPLLPLLAAGAGIAALLAFSGKDKGGGGGGSPIVGPGGNVIGVTTQLDANLPADVRQAVLIALQTEHDSTKLRAFAAALRGEGFPIAADNLEGKANALDVMNPNPPPLVPPGIPDAPFPIPPAPNQPPVIIPPAPPAFIPPVGPVPAPFFPPVVPSPTLPTAQEPDVAFDPGFPGNLPAIPPAGGAVTDAHRRHQQALVNFFTSHPVVDPTGQLDKQGDGFITYDQTEVDGSIGPHTQIATWAFQKWANRFRGLNLTLDGLPGQNTTAALKEFGA